MDWSLIGPLGIAAGLGLLVGLQRQWAHGHMAGIRTFPLITVLGVVVGVLGSTYGGWLPAAGFVALAALLVASNLVWAAEARDDARPDGGLTTEVAALVMFGVGVLLWLGRTVEGVVLGGGVAWLLHLKGPLHRMVDALSDADVRALFQFVVVALIVLPLLPDETFGPYDVLNPFEVWLMVALIVGISVAGWLAYRLLGHRTGTALTGVLGGLISSTATTVSQARHSGVEEDPARVDAAAFIVLMASTVAFARVVLEIGVVAPDRFFVLAPPLLVLMAVMLAVSLVEWRRAARDAGGGLTAEAPSELRTAIVFGLLYAVVLLAVAAAREHLGSAGLYAVAFLSGLTDMDAITLSTANLVRQDRVDPATGWRVVAVAGLANLAFKGAAVAMLGSAALRRPVLRGFGATVVAGIALILLWP